MNAKRTLLVTGASSGIGAQVCQLAMQQGHQAIGVARYSHQSPNDIDPSSASMIKVALDITDPSACEQTCLLYTSPSPRDRTRSRMPSSA